MSPPWYLFTHKLLPKICFLYFSLVWCTTPSFPSCLEWLDLHYVTYIHLLFTFLLKQPSSLDQFDYHIPSLFLCSVLITSSIPSFNELYNRCTTSVILFHLTTSFTPMLLLVFPLPTFSSAFSLPSMSVLCPPSFLPSLSLPFFSAQSLPPFSHLSRSLLPTEIVQALLYFIGYNRAPLPFPVWPLCTRMI